MTQQHEDRMVCAKCGQPVKPGNKVRPFFHVDPTDADHEAEAR
jgi:hypothetical protein